MFGVDTSTISSLLFWTSIVLNNVASARATVFDKNSSTGINSWSFTRRSSYKVSWSQSNNAGSLVA
jgi:hypothetical protein